MKRSWFMPLLAALFALPSVYAASPPQNAVEITPRIAGGSWTASATGISSERAYHTATKLVNGKILVVGGYDKDGNVVSDSFELYDPYADTLDSTVSNLNTARGYHTATLLPATCGNQVLVVGGVDSNNAVIGTAELYNPTTNTWTSAGTMTVARYSHTATLLPNSCKVLITGGVDSGGHYLASSEIYNTTSTAPSTWSSTWTATGALTTGRSWHTATLLADGKVLVTGGNGSNNVDFLNSSELYNPTAGTWSLTGTLLTGRNSHTATLLASNKVLVVGGYNDAKGGSLNVAEIYDPATKLWTSAAALATKRNQHTETRLDNGEVLITGGVNEAAGGTNTVLDSAEVYNPATNAWRSAGIMTGGGQICSYSYFIKYCC